MRSHVAAGRRVVGQQQVGVQVHEHEPDAEQDDEEGQVALDRCGEDTLVEAAERADEMSAERPPGIGVGRRGLPVSDVGGVGAVGRRLDRLVERALRLGRGSTSGSAGGAMWRSDRSRTAGCR